MYRVLVPVDRNETRAFHQARYVARLPNAPENVEATLLYVVPPDEFRQADEADLAETEAMLEATEYLEGEGVSVTATVDDGGVPQQIVRTADEIDADEIVVGGRKRSGVAKVLLGSTALDVVLSADRPVTITGESVQVGEGTRQLLVPVDDDEERARHQAEYVAGLPDAAEMVSATVLTVFRHQDYEGAPPHAFEEVDAAVLAADLLEDHGVAVERVGVGGEISRKIVDRADDIDADGIVVGGRKRSGVQKVLMGSTTQDVVVSAEHPVTITG